MHAMLWPGALVPGRNDVAMYAVEGPAAAPRLHELAVEPAG
ncbi:MAG TPA: hypothetical protein VFZ77_18130 [Acidimicrobiales bacterium]